MVPFSFYRHEAPVPRAMTVYDAAASAAVAAALPLLAGLWAVSEKRRRTVFRRLAPTPLPSLSAPAGSVWLHALSVGETLSAAPLVDRLQPMRRRHPLCVTTTTLTGHEIAADRFAGRMDALGYFPFDAPLCLDRAFRRYRPAVVVLVESDIWPGFLAAAHARGVPVVLANARLSERSLKGYRRGRVLIRPLLNTLARICCQSQQDARRFSDLGVDTGRLSVTGSTKFDQEVPAVGAAARAAWRARLGISAQAPLVLAASTHPGEEAVVLAAYRRLLRRLPAARLVIAPRDPRRAEVVCRLAAALPGGGVPLALVERDAAPPEKGVLVVDRMGMLARLVALSQAAVIGGSLVAEGGHNPLEAAAQGIPVLMGPDMRDFKAIADELTAAGGAVQVSDAEGLAGQLAALLTDGAGTAMGRRARDVFLRHRGAADRVTAVLARLMGWGEGDAPAARTASGRRR